MKQKTHLGFEVIREAVHEAELDLVIPFTTPKLTRVALDAANRMAPGLNARLRLVKVQVVPFPLEPDQSPVYLDFLKKQLAQFEAARPVCGEVRLARDWEAGLLSSLSPDCIVILAAPRRPWQTRNERLAAALRRAGHKVVLVFPEAEPEIKKEAKNA